MPREFIKLLLERGESGRTGRPALTSREGKGTELEGHGAASPLSTSTSHVRNLFLVLSV